MDKTTHLFEEQESFDAGLNNCCVFGDNCHCN